MPIDIRAKAKEIAGQARQQGNTFGANEDRGLMQELNYRKASKQDEGQRSMAKSRAQSRVNNSNQNNNNGSGINLEFDKLNKRKENNFSRLQELQGQEERSDFENKEVNTRNWVGDVLKNQEKARQGMQDAGYKGGLENYDAAAAGRKKFDVNDFNFLKRQGVDEAEIREYIGGLSKKERSDSLRFSKGTGMYMGDMAEGSKASDYDFRKQVTAKDINYLSKQGFSTEEIREAAKNSGVDTGFFAQNKLNKMIQNTTNNINNNSNNRTSLNNVGNTTNSNNKIDIDTDIRNSGNSGDGSGNTINGDGNAVGVGNVSMRDANVDNSKTYGNVNVTNSNVGAGSNIGNFDYSINMNNGNLNIGGMNGKENAGGNGESGFSALQAGVAGAALMQNLRARSNAVNGTPMDKAAEANARSKERFDYNDYAQKTYNLLGNLQNAMQGRATNSYANLFGDIYDGVTSPINYADRVTPEQPEDKTEEIANSFKY